MHQCFVWEFPSPFICSIQLSYFQSMTCAICVYFYICVVPYRVLLPKELIMLPFMFFWHKFQLISSLFFANCCLYFVSLCLFGISFSTFQLYISLFLPFHLSTSSPFSSIISLPSSLFLHLCSFVSLFLDLSIP